MKTVALSDSAGHRSGHRFGPCGGVVMEPAFRLVSPEMSTRVYAVEPALRSILGPWRPLVPVRACDGSGCEPGVAGQRNPVACDVPKCAMFIPGDVCWSRSMDVSPITRPILGGCLNRCFQPLTRPTGLSLRVGSQRTSGGVTPSSRGPWRMYVRAAQS